MPNKKKAITVSEAIGALERAFRMRSPNEVEQLLRETLNVQIAVVDDKAQAEEALTNRKKLKTITVPYGVFLGKAREILKERNEDGASIYSLEINPILSDNQPFILRAIYSEDILPGKTYAILSDRAGYSELKGLTFSGTGDSIGFEDMPEAECREKFTQGYFQTWKEHVNGVLKRNGRLEKIYRPFIENWTRNALAPQWKDDGEKRVNDFVDSILWAMRLVVLFHDIGKLKRDWQEVVWENEERIRGKKIKHEQMDKYIARTSYVNTEQTRRQLKKPPPHAPYAYPFLSAFLRNTLGDFRFLDAISLASARHHSLEVAGGIAAGKFNLADGATEFLVNWLPEVLKVDGEDKTKIINALNAAIIHTNKGSLADEPPSPSDDFYFLYCLTNRMVKLCDWEDAGRQTIELTGIAEEKENGNT